jgi:hypothetical protein
MVVVVVEGVSGDVGGDWAVVGYGATVVSGGSGGVLVECRVYVFLDDVEFLVGESAVRVWECGGGLVWVDWNCGDIGSPCVQSVGDR